MKIFTRTKASIAFVFAIIGTALLFARDTYHSTLVTTTHTTVETVRNYEQGFWYLPAGFLSLFLLMSGGVFVMAYLIGRTNT